MGTSHNSEMGCDSSRVQELEKENDELKATLKARDEWYNDLKGDLFKGGFRVRGSSRADNMDNDPLANIVLDPVEKAKVDEMILTDLKYLNAEDHKEDREVVESLFAEFGEDPASKECFKK